MAPAHWCMAIRVQGPVTVELGRGLRSRALRPIRLTLISQPSPLVLVEKCLVRWSWGKTAGDVWGPVQGGAESQGKWLQGQGACFCGQGLQLRPQSKSHQQREELVPSPPQTATQTPFPIYIGEGNYKTRYGWDFVFSDTIVFGEDGQFPSGPPGQFPWCPWQTPVPDAGAQNISKRGGET